MVVQWFTNGGQEMLEWFETRLLTVFGQGSAPEQMSVSLLLAVLTWSTTVITVGVSAILAVIFTFTFLWGLFRMIIGDTSNPSGGR